ncbi:MAG TPA: GldG family protein [Myxococcaceae bacterium]|nr:GldG family protein [Myxococcaceae bacterium]
MRPALIGKILGGVGLVLLLSSPYTLFITTGSSWLAALKALAGVALIGVYFGTNYGQLGQFASRKSSFFIASTTLMGVFLIAALVAVNYVAARKNKTWDLTSKKIYTLAPQTLTTLHGLKEKVRAIGFVQSSHPAYESLQQLFERYRREAPDKFDYVFKDPRKSPDLAAKYQLKEGQTTVVLTRGEGQQETHTALNVVSEQELTNALIKINSVGEQKVYFIAGHNEWPLEETAVAQGEQGASLSELKKTLQQEGYAPEAMNLAGKADVPKDAALVVVAGAKSKLAAPEAAVLKKYLDEGGRMLFFADANVDAGLDKLLAEYGVQIDPGIVADDRFAVQSPYVVLSMFYSDHEMTRILKQMQMNVEFPMSRGLSVLKEGIGESVKAEPVVLTSPFAWEELKPDDNPSPSSGEKTGQIPLVAASTRPVPAKDNKRFDEARLAVFGASQILVDVNWGHEPNRNLVMNGFAWATAQVNKITIRPPDRDISTLEIDNQLMSRIRFVATDLAPISVLAIGLAIWLSRRHK